MTDITMNTTSAPIAATQGSAVSLPAPGSAEEFRAVLDEVLTTAGASDAPAEDAPADGPALAKDGGSPGSAAASARASLIRAELHALVANQSALQSGSAPLQATSAGSAPDQSDIGEPGAGEPSATTASAPAEQKSNALPLASVAATTTTPEIPSSAPLGSPVEGTAAEEPELLPDADLPPSLLNEGIAHTEEPSGGLASRVPGADPAALLVQHPVAVPHAAAPVSMPRVVDVTNPSRPGAATSATGSPVSTLPGTHPDSAVQVLDVQPAKPTAATHSSMATSTTNTNSAPLSSATTGSTANITAPLPESTSDGTLENATAFTAGSPTTQLAVSRLMTAPASAPVIATPAQVPQHVASLLPDGGSVTLALHPEDLGPLVITVSRTGNSVSVTIAGSQSALASIAADAISDAVTVTGMSIARVELVPATNTSETSRQAPHDSRNPDQQQGQGRQSGSERQPTQRDTVKEHDDQE